MKKIITNLLFIFVAGFGGAFGSTCHALQAGISIDYIKEEDENIIYTSPVNLNQIPGFYYSDLGYFVKFRPLNMLSALEIENRITKDKKIKVSQISLAPSVYNISFANGGSFNYQSDENQDIEELVKRNPNRPEYLYAFALKLKKEKKYIDAINEIDKALKLDYNYALGHFLKADILRNTGNFKEAAKEYMITIEINPYCTDAYFNIAKMLEIYGNTELALNYYEMAYEVSPNDLEIRNQILKLSKVRA